jgi:plasmid stabilization system protein ParE
MLPYHLTDRALQDLAAAREWYERQRPDLGRKFIDAAFTSVSAARARPYSFPEIGNGVRTALCGRFPYRVHFEIADAQVVVHAVYHTARDPQLWNDPERE